MSLTLRLISACRQAYNVARDGTVAPVAAVGPVPATADAGWTSPPVGVVAGSEDQDAALVGTFAEGVVIAIRGTTPFGDGSQARFVADWAGDFAAPLVTAAEGGFPGQVHWGFYQAFMRLWTNLHPLVDAAVKAHAARTIFVTGHSKGGALAAFVAWRLHLDYPEHRLAVRAIAPARMGDAAFASAYDAAITDHVRYEFDDDIVPHVPLCGALAAAIAVPAHLGRLLATAGLGYASVGRLGFITLQGAIVDDYPGLEALRVLRLAGMLGSPGGLDYVGRCHAIDDPGAGYVRAAYPA